MIGLPGPASIRSKSRKSSLPATFSRNAISINAVRSACLAANPASVVHILVFFRSCDVLVLQSCVALSQASAAPRGCLFRLLSILQLPTFEWALQEQCASMESRLLSYMISLGCLG